MRPCGACRALIESSRGCAHWRGMLEPLQREIRRIRNAGYGRAARERARADVAAFRRVMARGRPE